MFRFCRLDHHCGFADDRDSGWNAQGLQMFSVKDLKSEIYPLLGLAESESGIRARGHLRQRDIVETFRENAVNGDRLHCGV